MAWVTKVYFILLMIWYLLFIGYALYLFLRYQLPYSRKFQDNVLEEIPVERTPAELSVLLYHKIKPEVFTANILLLIKSGAIYLKNEKDHGYVLYRRDFDMHALTSQEYMIKFLFDIIGNGEKVSLTQINDYCKGTRNMSDFFLNYEIWRKAARAEVQKRFYEPKLIYSQIKTYEKVAILLFVINFIAGHFSFWGFFILVPALILHFYFEWVEKRTMEANEEYHQWLAFKNYLLNENNYPPELQGFYLEYGFVLGIGDEVEKKVFQKDDDLFVSALNKTIHNCTWRSQLFANRRIPLA